MKEPTEAQIKEFWKRCGLELIPHIDRYSSGDYNWIEYRKDGVRVDEPKLDLNNLFKYAERPFVSMACGSLNEEGWKGAWAKVITHDRLKIGELREEGLTPALALFWAIWEVIG